MGTGEGEVTSSDAEPGLGSELIERDREHPTDRDPRSPARWLFALGAIGLLAVVIYLMVAGSSG